MMQRKVVRISYAVLKWLIPAHTGRWNKEEDR
jgi:hypothetical protein